MDMIISINKEITDQKYKGYTPTHIRIHPETFKKICKRYTEKEVRIPEGIYMGGRLNYLALLCGWIRVSRRPSAMYTI
jgi:hypothetical protein